MGRLRFALAAALLSILLTGCGGGGASAPLDAAEGRKTLAAAATQELQTIQAPPGLKVARLEKVEERRTGRTTFEYDFRVVLDNQSVGFTAAQAVLAAGGAGTSIKQGVATFGAIGDGAMAQSTNLVTITHDRTTPFVPAELVWTLSATKPADGPIRLKPTAITYLEAEVAQAAAFDVDSGLLTLPGMVTLRAGVLVYAAESLLQVVETQVVAGNTVAKVKPVFVADLLQTAPTRLIGAVDPRTATISFDANSLQALRELIDIFDDGPSKTAAAARPVTATAASSTTAVTGPLALPDACTFLLALDSTAKCSYAVAEFSNVAGVELKLTLKDGAIEIKQGIYPDIYKIDSSTGKATGIVHAPATFTIKVSVGKDKKLGSWRDKFAKGFAPFGAFRFLTLYGGGYIKVTPRVEPIFPAINQFTLSLSAAPFVKTKTVEVGLTGSPSLTLNGLGLTSGMINGQPNPLYEVTTQVGLKFTVSTDYHLGIFLRDDIEDQLRVGGIKVGVATSLPITAGLCLSQIPGDATIGSYLKATSQLDLLASADAFSKPLISQTLRYFPLEGEQEHVVYEEPYPTACKSPTTTAWRYPAAGVNNTATSGESVVLSVGVAAHPAFTNPAKALSDPLKAKTKVGEPPKASEWVVFKSVGQELCRALVEASTGNASCSFTAPRTNSTMAVRAEYLGNSFYRPSASDAVQLTVSTPDYAFEFRDADSSVPLTCWSFYGAQGSSPVAWSSLLGDYEHCFRRMTPQIRCVGGACRGGRFMVTTIAMDTISTYQDISSGLYVGTGSCPASTSSQTTGGTLTYPGYNWGGVQTSFGTVNPYGIAFGYYPSLDHVYHIRNVKNLQFIQYYPPPYPVACVRTAVEMRFLVRIHDTQQNSYSTQLISSSVP